MGHRSKPLSKEKHFQALKKKKNIYIYIYIYGREGGAETAAYTYKNEYLGI